ncbi:hybrid sensor histidine kinase/response regulator [Noviherbaspirillum galbum]|uniref:histidine kinase n=1 Tax=Noviherbaspirillum galbum TaxID=2709383 RepID=A0A6B3SMN7_9BURK|nr:ATP-binding protein [Noviherbaspirillum galbum]NEX62110.1 response regulator [Noviherbaspirillum galbum]
MPQKSYDGLATSVGVLAAYAATACIILVAGASAYLNSRYQESTTQAVLATQQVADLLDQVESAMTDAETGQRGYLLTDQREFLEPYWSAIGQAVPKQGFDRPSLHELLDRLDARLVADAEGRDDVRRIQQLAQVKLDELHETLALHDAGKSKEALAILRSGRGKATMDELRVHFARLHARIRGNVEAQEQERRRAFRQAYLSAGVISVLSLGTLLALILATRHAERQVALAQRRLNRLSDSDLIGVVFGDLDGGIEYANDEYLRIIGYKRKEFEKGKFRWDRITPPEWLEVDRRHIEEARRTGFSGRYEKEYVRQDGSRIPVMVGFAFMDNSRRDVIAFTLDLTELKRQQAILLQQEEQLKLESRQKDEFIAVLAHELRNPLAPIQAGIDLMKLMPSPSGAFDHTRDVMDRQLSHLVRLIDDLLDISRINAGKFELRLERVDAADVVSAALEASDAYIVGAGHALDVALPDEPVYIRADAVRMAQVLTNLLNNAAKYTPSGGHIWLSVRRQDDTAVFEVKDDGIGIEAGMQERVFDMFSQDEHGRNLRKGGIGIGLPLTRRLVELHDGRITVKSAAGAGSSFSVILPLDTQQQPAATLERPSAGSGDRQSKRILIVDDNVDAARTLGHLMQASGHDVSYAHDGAQAIVLAASCRADVVFLDIGLPDMSGYDVARVLRSKPELQRTRLVALTGWGADQDRQKSRECGIDFHLTKPARLETIREMFPGLV